MCFICDGETSDDAIDAIGALIDEYGCALVSTQGVGGGPGWATRSA
jgi:hypothetical protein